MSCTSVRSGPAVAPFTFPDCGPLFCNPSMVAFYPLDEASGAALDAHTGGYDLTAYGAPDSDTGKVYPLARRYASAPYHSSDGCETPFRGGDVDFTWAGWVKMTSIAATCTLLSKWYYTAPGQTEYLIGFNQVSKLFTFTLMAPDGIHTGTTVSTSFGAISAGVWYFLAAWHDSVANTINIQVNNGTVDDQAWGYAGSMAGDGNLDLSGYDGGSSDLNGLLQCWGFWRSTAYGGGVLNAAQRQMLYNSGAGLTYAEMCAL